jgi:alcohol dehydrogenase class IV
VTSNKTLKILKNNVKYDEIIIVKEPPKEEVTRKYKGRVIAVGGGSVIDYAKMISRDKPIYAIPTTASGSACTSWSVVWKPDDKVSIKCTVPILCEQYKILGIKLSTNVAESTYYDCKAHLIDSRMNRNANSLSSSYCSIGEDFLKRYEMNNDINDLIEAGNYAGRAIEITGTGLFHALSYIITLEYGVEHGQALKSAMYFDKKYNWNKIINKAKLFEKFGNHL